MTGGRLCVQVALLIRLLHVEKWEETLGLGGGGAITFHSLRRKLKHASV